MEDFASNLEKRNSLNILKCYGIDLEKSLTHKYFKREGAPGNYKYYYTEADYKAGKHSSEEPKEEDKSASSSVNSSNLSEVISILERAGFKINEKLSNENRISSSSYGRNGDHTFLIQRELGHPAGDYYISMQSKIETSSVSLADPRAAYQTTSARRVVHKKVNTRDYSDTLQGALKIVVKHLKKINK